MIGLHISMPKGKGARLGALCNFIFPLATWVNLNLPVITWISEFLAKSERKIMQVFSFGMGVIIICRCV